MTANPIETPQNLRDVSGQSLKLAHAEYENLTDFVIKAMGIWMGAMPANPIATGLLTFAEKASKAGTFQELLTLQTQFAQDQMKASAMQAQKLYKLIGERLQHLQQGQLCQLSAPATTLHR